MVGSLGRCGRSCRHERASRGGARGPVVPARKGQSRWGERASRGWRERSSRAGTRAPAAATREDQPRPHETASRPRAKGPITPASEDQSRPTTTKGQVAGAREDQPRPHENASHRAREDQPRRPREPVAAHDRTTVPVTPARQRHSRRRTQRPAKAAPPPSSRHPGPRPPNRHPGPRPPNSRPGPQPLSSCPEPRKAQRKAGYSGSSSPGPKRASSAFATSRACAATSGLSPRSA